MDRNRKLDASQKSEGRRIARAAWVKSGGDPALAESIARSEFQKAGFSPAVIFLLIKVALFLFQWWLSRKVSNPPELFDPEEPNLEDALK